MPDVGLAPGVEDAQESDRCAQVSRIGSHLEQCGRTGLEQQVVDQGRVAVAQGHERMRQREHDVDVRHLEQLAFPGGQPSLARLRLALGTVPVPTRIWTR